MNLSSLGESASSAGCLARKLGNATHAISLSLIAITTLLLVAHAMPPALHAQQQQQRSQEALSLAMMTARSGTLIRSRQASEIEHQRARLTAADVEERRDAVQRLGALKRADASRIAAIALRDDASIVRATATAAVLSLPPDEAASALKPLLQDRDEFVRRQAAYALGETHVRAVVPALTSALATDKSAGVRGAAAIALGEIGDEAAVTPLTQALVRRFRAGGTLNRVRRRTTIENEFVRLAAARALGQTRSRAAIPALITVLTDEKMDDDVRREAARSLGLINDPAAIAALQSALAAPDPYLSRIAFDALQKLNPVSATHPALTTPPKKSNAKMPH